MMEDSEELSLEELLKKLLSEHQELNNKIESCHDTKGICMIDLQRLKKRKLFLKDQITHIESKIFPDIIA